jgi:NAD(P)-dependent dehydrogenase (short-subunit alcohol dehydrogenase family)
MIEDVIVIIGAGGIGAAIARRQGFGKTILLADINSQTLDDAATLLRGASYTVHTQIVDVTSRSSVRKLAGKAASLGRVLQLFNTAGLSPNMATPQKVLEVDLFGVALVFDEFENVIASGGSAIVISSMAGYMSAPLPPEQEYALAHTPTDELLALPFLAADAVPIPWRPMVWQKRPITYVFKPPACRGASAVRGSIRSAQVSSRPPWRSMKWRQKVA